MTLNVQRWQPPTFKDPNTTNAFKAAFQSIYNLEAQAVIGAVQGSGIASGVTAVVGSKKGIATGLATVLNVVGCINGIGPSNLWVTARPTPNAPGLIDLYVFMPTNAGDNTPIPGASSVDVSWIAFGTPVSQESA